jgi:hypothetical protein
LPMSRQLILQQACGQSPVLLSLLESLWFHACFISLSGWVLFTFFGPHCTT